MDEFLRHIKNAGVVGAGGAGFPTHVKLNARVEYVIINGAECEPLLKANQQMLSKYAKYIWSTLQDVMTHTRARRGIISLKKKYRQALVNLEQTKPADSRLSIHCLQDFYPAGDEQVLVHEVTGRIVPEGGIPLKVGCVVINVETLFNIRLALQDIPVINKYVTIAGAVKNPQTVAVPVGTRHYDLIALAGGTTVNHYSIISGGPMMGVLENNGAVVTKTTGGIIVLPAEHPLVRYKKTNLHSVVIRARAVCCQCRACTDLCPRYLQGHDIEPHKIMRALAAGKTEQYMSNAYLCSECGVCDKFACPMDLAPRQVNIMFKRELLNAGIKNPQQRSRIEASPFREFRKVPSQRLLMRLGLEPYNLPAPFVDSDYVPAEVRIPLRQHTGKPAAPLVKPGDCVEKGQLIGEIPDEPSLGARIHASIKGTVQAVNDAILIQGQ